jgi:predicted DNA-binding protein (UPF0251 family)
MISYLQPPVAPLAHVHINHRNLAIIPTDHAGVSRLVSTCLERSGLSGAEAARRMGISPQTLHQYKSARRTRTSLEWLLRLVEVCGGHIYIELPPDKL